MAKKKKHSVLRIRKKSRTDRSRLNTMVIPDKKKEDSKKKCRRKDND